MLPTGACCGPSTIQHMWVAHVEAAIRRPRLLSMSRRNVSSLHVPTSMQVFLAGLRLSRRLCATVNAHRSELRVDSAPQFTFSTVPSNHDLTKPTSMCAGYSRTRCSYPCRELCPLPGWSHRQAMWRSVACEYCAPSSHAQRSSSWTPLPWSCRNRCWMQTQAAADVPGAAPAQRA
jgi:hypothetical protein